MKVVIDTNIIVSALLTPAGKPAQVVELVYEGKIFPILSEEILFEYRTILERPKLELSHQICVATVDGLFRRGTLVVTTPWLMPLPDPKDAIFLEAAWAGKAEALVTGNLRDFPEGLRSGISVFSPVEFLEFLKTKNE